METTFESLIQGILDHGFATTLAFFDKNLIEELRHRLLDRQAKGLMHPAGIGKLFQHQKNREIRGDLISWLDEHSPDYTEKQFLDSVEAFYRYLNRTCYTGIDALEFHYALYRPGSFYKRHLDQFRHDSGRRFSMITYLNADWQTTDGGQLVLYLPGAPVEILPEPGRVVFFKSDQIEHEVKPAQRDRLSITGWLLKKSSPL